VVKEKRYFIEFILSPDLSALMETYDASHDLDRLRAEIFLIDAVLAALANPAQSERNKKKEIGKKAIASNLYGDIHIPKSERTGFQITSSPSYYF
jgi:hypothetical protein